MVDKGFKRKVRVSAMIYFSFATTFAKPIVLVPIFLSLGPFIRHSLASHKILLQELFSMLLNNMFCCTCSCIVYSILYQLLDLHMISLRIRHRSKIQLNCHKYLQRVKQFGSISGPTFG